MKQYKLPLKQRAALSQLEDLIFDISDAISEDKDKDFITRSLMFSADAIAYFKRNELIDMKKALKEAKESLR